MFGVENEVFSAQKKMIDGQRVTEGPSRPFQGGQHVGVQGLTWLLIAFLQLRHVCIQNEMFGIFEFV